jgi:hypothetical protein
MIFYLRFKIKLTIMKKKLLLSILTLVLLLGANTSFSQATNGTLNLGILESFEAFTAAGGVTNSGGTVTGDVGTHLGIISGFPSPPNTGNSYTANASTNQARYDLLRLYIHLNSKAVNFPNAFSPFQPAHASVFTGTLTPGVYAIGAAGSISGALTLDGGGNPDAVFVIKMNGALTVDGAATVSLANGAKSSNVFWLINGAISVGADAKVIGTLFSKAGAVGLGAGVILEGRMLSLGGAITFGLGSSATPPPLPCTIPVFCESICNPAPAANILGVLSSYVLFAKAGPIGNTGLSGINGIIGTNAGAIGGYASGVHIGSEQIANTLTAQAATDLDSAFNSLMAMTPTVTTHAASFLNETLAPGVYHITTAGALGGTVILDAANDPNAIFVFRFAAAFDIAADSKIILANGAQRCNVFWLSGAGPVGGALNIGASSEVQGTFLAHGGACNSGAGVFMSGRQLSTDGAVNTNNPVIYGSPECVTSLTLKTTAVADSPSVAAGANTPSVIANDISKGVQAIIGTAPGQVTLTYTNTATLTMNLDGTITVAANALPGTYPITYTICEVSNTAICSTVTSNITVTAPVATIWTGTTSNAWNDATNWNSGVPLSGGRIEISGGLTNYPVLDQTRTIGNVTIGSGATLNLNNNTLVVSGTFSGTGTLIGSTTSGLNLNGTGNQGTFYMNQTTPGTSNKIANFNLDATATGSTTLGNAMSISGILTLTNGTFNTGGNLTLTSNGIGTAVVAPITDCSAVAITGDVTVERFFPAGRAFRLISSPVTTTSTIRENWQEGTNNATTTYANNSNPKPGYGTHITGNMTNGAIYGFDATQTTANSMFTFDNTTSAWAAVPNTNSSTITAGVPYRLMIRGSRAINMDTNAPTADNTILRAKGALKICDAPAGTLSQGANGFSFIGNPYQATVNIKAVLSPSLINPNPNLNSNFYYVWDPKVSTRGGYVNYDLNSNMNTVLGSSVNQYLQPWQACFVQTTSAGVASITFQESNKSPLESVRENVFRTNNLASYIRLTLYESNTLASNGAAADGLIVKFGDNYVNSIDGYDALKFNNLDETFSTKNNTSLLGIESRLFPVASELIPLNITQYRFTNYTMVANGTNMSGLPAYLHDRLLQTYTEIPQSGSVNYSYVLDATNTASSASDRFRIVFQNSTLSIGSNTALAFTMYPNPSKQGVFDVVMNDATEGAKLVIYNTIGQEVYATNLTKTTINHINPNMVFSNGVYYVKIKKDATTTIKKLIIR